MKVLVIGSGGREHALCWKLKQSPSVDELFCAPGNAGIEQLAVKVPLKADDVDGLLKFAVERGIDLTVAGPEQPLVLGIVDAFMSRGLTIFGPTKAAARLEGSKAFAKDFMARHHIPTARSKNFKAGQRKEAGQYAKELGNPLVVKADGLAAGKGVLICEKKEAVDQALGDIMDRKVFGSAGELVVVEEFLRGEEASVFAVCDGSDFVLLASAQDHKRILDGDLGKNTGGMGAYAPAPIMTAEFLQQVEREVVRPTLRGMAEEGSPYRGCLYVGLMITQDGPKVLEYNCRFGDPETQVVVPLIDGDLALLLQSAAQGAVDRTQARPHKASAVCIVMASHGYPDAYETGKEIHGLDKVHPEEGEVVFHAGTRAEKGRILSAGGRVLGVTAVGYDHDLEGTIQAAYRIVDKITFDGAYFRSDIGQKALKHIKESGGRAGREK